MICRGAQAIYTPLSLPQLPPPPHPLHPASGVKCEAPLSLLSLSLSRLGAPPPSPSNPVKGSEEPRHAPAPTPDTLGAASGKTPSLVAA